MPELTKKAALFIAPGRGVLTTSPKKLPSIRKAFTDLAKAYEAVAHKHTSLTGEPELLAAATAARQALLSGTVPDFDARQAAMMWRLLSDIWEAGYFGTPRPLNKGRSLAVKIARYYVRSGGAAGAMAALLWALTLEPAAGNRLARFDPPGHPTFDHSVGYQLKPGFLQTLLTELRLLMIGADEADYQAAVALAREAWPTLPLHLKVAVNYVVPTEIDLARQALAELTALTEYTPQNWPGRHTFSPIALERQWPTWVAQLAWCLETEADFAPLFSKLLGGGWTTTHLYIAVWSICPSALPERYLSYPLQADGYLTR